MKQIVLGESDIVLAGGTENMSQAPFAVRDIRWGPKFGSELKVFFVCFILYFLCCCNSSFVVFSLIIMEQKTFSS